MQFFLLLSGPWVLYDLWSSAQAALEREIQDTLKSWKERLQAAALIFVHAPSSNAAALFGGDHPALERGDARIRSVPFTTRRPTFTETKRVLTTLLSVHSAELPPNVPAGAFHFQRLLLLAGSLVAREVSCGLVSDNDQ